MEVVGWLRLEGPSSRHVNLDPHSHRSRHQLQGRSDRGDVNTLQIIQDGSIGFAGSTLGARHYRSEVTPAGLERAQLPPRVMG